MNQLNRSRTLLAWLCAAGLLSDCCTNTLARTHYVDVNSTNATPPYITWATAATIIQDAVDAAVAGEEIVVTNGIYASGGRTDGLVAVDKPLVLRSVSGPQFTIIDGRRSVRCISLCNGSSLCGFALTNGFAIFSGGGVACESTNVMISNCVVSGNSLFDRYNGVPVGGGGVCGGTLNNCTLSDNRAWAYWYGTSLPPIGSGGGACNATLNNCTLAGNSSVIGGGADMCRLNNCTLVGNAAFSGGGASASTLNNCILTGNRANEGEGGGAYECTLNDCTLTGNSADFFDYCCGHGGGVALSSLNNCTLVNNSAYDSGGAWGSRINNSIVYFNAAAPGTNQNYDSCTLNYCCTSPLSANGFGNITNAPLLVDTNRWSDVRLHSNSPCINAGNNAYAPAGPDLDGNLRIRGGTVDIGAYEFQALVSKISYAWLQQYDLPINASTDTADPDSDGVDNYHEWLANSDPTNPFSFPPLLTLIPYGPNIILTWPTNAVGFTVQSATNVASTAAWVTNSPAPVVIGGQNVVIDPIAGPRQFYRLVH